MPQTPVTPEAAEESMVMMMVVGVMSDAAQHHRWKRMTEV
jgi:hypothetical protein